MVLRSSQLSKTSVVMGLRKEYIPTTLLDQHNTSTLLILYVQVISAVPLIKETLLTGTGDHYRKP